MMKLSAIVAMSQNRVIGKDGKLPWHLSEDLKRFRAITTGHPIIMGRKTFESIGRILPNRENIIISRNKDYRVEGARVVNSVETAIQPFLKSVEEVFVIGGAEIYQMTLSRLDRIYLTLIHAQIEGDATFPEFDLENFIEVSREDRQEPLPHSFLVLEKRH